MTVKPKLADHTLVAAAFTAVATALALFLIWSPASGQDGDRLGAALVGTLAQSSINPILAQDRIHLGVLANRLMAIDGVLGVSVYDADNQLLALSGTHVHGSTASAPVTLDDTVIGFVRVTLAGADDTGGWLRIFATALALLVVPALSAWSARKLRNLGTESAVAGEDERDGRVAWIETVGYVVVANFYNQLSLHAGERASSSRAGLATAQAVARLYGGTTAMLDGRGVALSFDGSVPRPFEIACAAFVLAECLRRESSAEYRFAVHRFESRVAPGDSADDASDLRIAAQDDAALLSALARPGAVVASAEFCAELGDRDQVCADPFRHPLLEGLETIDGLGCRIGLLDVEHERLIGRQATAVLDQARPAADQSAI
jgi:hypothetical protein